ncbi:hypothetical protein [Agrobacterium burrii]
MSSVSSTSKGVNPTAPQTSKSAASTSGAAKRAATAPNTTPAPPKSKVKAEEEDEEEDDDEEEETEQEKKEREEREKLLAFRTDPIFRISGDVAQQEAIARGGVQLIEGLWYFQFPGVRTDAFMTQMSCKHRNPVSVSVVDHNTEQMKQNDFERRLMNSALGQQLAKQVRRNNSASQNRSADTGKARQMDIPWRRGTQQSTGGKVDGDGWQLVKSPNSSRRGNRNRAGGGRNDPRTDQIARILSTLLK